MIYYLLHENRYENETAEICKKKTEKKIEKTDLLRLKRKRNTGNTSPPFFYVIPL